MRPVVHARVAFVLVIFLVGFLALGAAACGGSGDSCAGYITVNATPAECARIAEQFGCTSYDVNGPSCGLTACATCEGL